MSKQVRKGSKFNKRGGSNANRREFSEEGLWGDRESSSSSSDVENAPKAVDQYAAETTGKTKGKPTGETIETMNPNDNPTRNIKISELSIHDAPGNRKEREALEAARKKEAYFKLQMEGKTAQAKSDLARLAIIRKQREDAAKKRADAAEAKSKPSSAKESSMNAGKSIISKSLGKK